LRSRVQNKQKHSGRATVHDTRPETKFGGKIKMRKMMKLMAVIVAIAMISAMAIATSVSANEIPNTVSRTQDGKTLTIGFFNFVDNRGTHLEIRLDTAPSGFGLTQEVTMSGITRIRDMLLNDDLFEGAVAGAPAAGQIVFAGGITQDFGFADDPVKRAAQAAVDNVGTLTFGGGEFAVLWPDGSSTLFDLNGVVISNAQAVATTTTAADTTPVATTTGEPGPGGDGTTTAADTTPSGPPNPPTGVAIAIIPTLIAAGAAIVASRKRK
jgi:hypothetical protein